MFSAFYPSLPAGGMIRKYCLVQRDTGNNMQVTKFRKAICKLHCTTDKYLGVLWKVVKCKY